MISIQPTIPFIPTQPIPNTSAARKVAAARQRVLQTMRAAVSAINCEIFRLETTGDLVDRDIEKAFEAWAWAFDALREEQEIAALEDDVTPLKRREVA